MGIAAPFVLGVGLAHIMHPYVGEGVGELGFALFMGTAMSITALPMLGRIMMELKISRTRVGAITITAAAVDDAVGWMLLATVSALVQARFQVLHSVRMLALTGVFAAGMILLVRPVMRWWIVRAMRRGQGRLGLNQMAVVLIVLLLCAIATSLIGIFAIFGAFMLGAVLSSEHEFRDTVKSSLSSFVTAFFLPIFFTYTGLRTDIGRLDSLPMWIMAGAVLLAAVAGKFGGCSLAARMSGFSGRESICIGVLMNTRALMELVVINVGYDLKVIPQSVFCMLVIMALATTVMTTPVLLLFMQGTELEAGVRQSAFVRRHGPVLQPVEA
jgi:Kef-type K+ transport system membrane component KefB